MAVDTLEFQSAIFWTICSARQNFFVPGYRIHLSPLVLHCNIYIPSKRKKKPKRL